MTNIELTELERLEIEIVNCVSCRLHHGRTQAVPGMGNFQARIVFIGEGPGREEDRTGMPFVGSAGKNLSNLLEIAGIDRDDIFITNIVKCRPPRNRKPAASEIEACTQFLWRQLREIRPALIVTLGVTALRVFFPEAIISLAHGDVMKYTGNGLNSALVPMYHPAAAIYNRNLMPILEKDFGKLGNLISQGGMA